MESSDRREWADYIAIANRHKSAPYIEDVKQRVRPTTLSPDQLAASQIQSLDAQATAFAYEYKDRLCYMAARKSWLYWEGHVWKADGGSNVANELAKEFGRRFAYPVDGETDEQKDARLKWLHRLTAPKGIADLLTLAKTDPMLAVYPHDFDVVPVELNTPAGIYDLRTGDVKPATPEQLVMRSTSVSADASVSTPLYEQLLSEAFPGRPELAEYFESMMGVSLVRGQSEQVFVYMFGAAGSGKGTLMSLARGILGSGASGYTVNIDSSLFVKSRSQQHPTEMMQFLGARMAISSEVTQGAQMDTGKLKRVTGGDAITGRYMGQDFVDFDATHTLWIMANDRLQVPSDDNGVWRRLRVLPFDFAKREGSMVGNLDKLILASEASGILARWIDAARRYLSEGLETPQAVVEAREEYKRSSDTVQEWIDFDCDVEAGSFCSTSALFDRYEAWCKRDRRKGLTLRNFSMDLENKGYQKTTQRVGTDRKQVRGYFGLSIPIY